MTCYEHNWISNDGSNCCLIDNDTLLATVFSKKPSAGYGAVVNCPETGNAYFFPGKIMTEKDGKSVVEDAIDRGSYNKLPWRTQQRGWRRSKKTGNLYRRANGGIYTIKRASSGSFYVNTQNGSWSCPMTGTRWFSSEEVAQLAVDRAIAGGDDGPEEEIDFDSIDFGDSDQ